MHLPGTFTQGLLPLDPGPVPSLQLYSRISPFGHFAAIAGAVNVMATISRVSVFNMGCNLLICLIRRSAYADPAARSYSNSRGRNATDLHVAACVDGAAARSEAMTLNLDAI